MRRTRSSKPHNANNTSNATYYPVIRSHSSKDTSPSLYNLSVHNKFSPLATLNAGDPPDSEARTYANVAAFKPKPNPHKPRSSSFAPLKIHSHPRSKTSGNKLCQLPSDHAASLINPTGRVASMPNRPLISPSIASRSTTVDASTESVYNSTNIW